MIEDVDLIGGFVSVAFFTAATAGLFCFIARPFVKRLSIDRVSWQPFLLDLTLFLSLWWGLSVLANRLLPYLNLIVR